MGRYIYLLFVLGLLCSPSLFAQERLTPEEIASYKEQTKQLVSFLEFSLNTLGNPNSTSREKNTIINTTYLKVFRDAQVQIEDDLAPNRSTVTNKDVASYLKDIDFFFKEASFSYEVEEVTHSINDFDQHFFLVKMKRKLVGTTVENDRIDNTLPRFMEINLDEQQDELKIVSIYTTKLNELAGIQGWWNNLPIDWKLLFAEEISIKDSLTMRDALLVNTSLKLGDTLYLPRTDTIHKISDYLIDEIIASKIYPVYDSTLFLHEYDTISLNTANIFSDIREILDLRELDLSNQGLTSVAPLSKMTRLRRLNISNNPVNSIETLKSLSVLQSLDCSFTQIEDLEALKFLPEISELNISNTFVSNISPLAYLEKLELLNCSFTQIANLAPLADNKLLQELDCQQTLVSTLAPVGILPQLSRINCANTPISSLDPIANLPSLESLICNNTDITTLEPLQQINTLTQLFCENTDVASLEPLSELPNLTSIYCDQTNITEQAALDYMRRHPNTLVIYKSDDLRGWWASMSPIWKDVLEGEMDISDNPSKAALQAIANRSTLDIRDNKAITDLGPVSMLRNLQTLYIDGTNVNSLAPLSSLIDLNTLTLSRTKVNSLDPLRYQKSLVEIDFSATRVNSIEPLSELPRLTKITCNDTPIDDLLPLIDLPRIEHIYCDNTRVFQPQVMAFLSQKPECLIIYHSEELLDWWLNVSLPWQDIFRKQVSLDEVPTPAQLHQIEYLSSLNIEGNTSITSLDPVIQLKRLKNLQISRTQIADLSPLSNLPQLERLTCAESPLRSLDPISGLQQLIYLDIANTPIEDLDALSNLVSLETLICSGTQIKDIKPISSLTQLKVLDCANTRVKKLSPLKGIEGMTSLTCYNTRVSNKEIRAFKTQHPEAQVVYY